MVAKQMQFSWTKLQWARLLPGWQACGPDSGAAAAVVLTIPTSLSGLWQRVHLSLILLLIIKDIFRFLKPHTVRPHFNQKYQVP